MLEQIGLFCFYGITALEDFRTKQIRLIEIAFFGIIGILIDVMLRPYSLLSIIGGVFVGVVLYVFSIVTNEKIGKADALIVMVSGLYLGFMNILVLLWISSVFAAIGGGLFLLTIDRESTGDFDLPFMPFMLAGYMVLMFINQTGGI